MDEEIYKLACDNIVPIHCAFEKSILALRVFCSQAVNKNIAEREVVQCTSLEHQLRCQQWLSVLRKNSAFALRLTDESCVNTALPHSKEMKVQVGGIEGLVSLLSQNEPGIEMPDNENKLYDVDFILNVSDCLIAEVPFDKIVKSVVQVQLRKK